MIYGMPAYQLGAAEPTPAAAQAALRDMRRTLKRWLNYRLTNDAVATGKKPGKVPPKVAAVMLQQNRDWDGERRLAEQIHALLSEVFDTSELPKPEAPNAAVKLAKIAIAGKLPAEANAPSAQGLIWLWPLVIVAGVVAFSITSYIRTQAEVQMDKEHKECIKMGACTDYGFWLKAAAVGVGGYLLWNAGLGDKVRGWFKK